MTPPERLTIDLTVARDFLEPARERHLVAQELFALARRRVVELTVAPQGLRLDVGGDLAEQLQSAFGDEGVEEARQLAYLSEVTYPSPALFPGQYVSDFGPAWEHVVGAWRSHEGKPPKLADRFHVETHTLEGRDVFITDDRPLRAMCRRLSGEHGFQVVAMGLAEYLEARRRPDSEPEV